MRNGNFLKMHVSEICVKRIRVNQGLGVVILHIFWRWLHSENTLWDKDKFICEVPLLFVCKLWPSFSILLKPFHLIVNLYCCWVVPNAFCSRECILFHFCFHTILLKKKYVFKIMQHLKINNLVFIIGYWECNNCNIVLAFRT